MSSQLQQHHQKSSQADIYLSAIRDNFNLSQQLAGTSESIAVIKANAYGHGAIEAARALKDKAQYFVVARLCEALALREAGIEQAIVILSEAMNRDLLDDAGENNFHLVIHQIEDIQFFCEQNLEHPITLWLKVDTGMHRLGVDVNTADQHIERLINNTNCQELRLMTHFACADAEEKSFLIEQNRLFDQLAERYPTLKKSAANSAAILQGEPYLYDFVRPGIMLYGANPLFEHQQPLEYELACTMRFSAPVIAIKTIAAGESVGYNRRWFADKESRIAVVGAGYADGYPRHIQANTMVAINGQHAPVVGTVSMDMICVDISQLSDVSVGDSVELWGPNIDVNAVAKSANTISYQLFCNIGKRVKRVYHD